MGSSNDALIYASIGSLANVGQVGYLVDARDAPSIRGLYDDPDQQLTAFGDQIFHPVQGIGLVIPALSIKAAVSTSALVKAAPVSPTSIFNATSLVKASQAVTAVVAAKAAAPAPVAKPVTSAPAAVKGPPASYGASITASSDAALAAQPPTFTGTALNNSDLLRSNDSLQPGQWVGSAKMRLGIYRGDCILLDQVNRRVLWTTGVIASAKGKVATVKMNSSGNFSCYGADGAMLWNAGTGSFPNAHMEVRDEGNAVIYDVQGVARFDVFAGAATKAPKSRIAPPPASITANITASSNAALAAQAGNQLASYNAGNMSPKLKPGQALLDMKYLLSPNGAYRLQLVSGALQIRKVTGPNWVGDVVWPGWGGPSNRVDRVIMQSDGNLVCIRDANTVVAASDTGGEKGVWLELRDDGVAYCIDQGGSFKWDSVHGTATAGGAVAVIKNAADVIIHNPVVDLITVPYKMAAEVVAKIATGDLSGAWGSLKSNLADVANNPVVKVGASFVGTVPGLGTLSGAALQAGLALARGESLSAIGLAAIRGALPGGPLAQMAFDGGIAALQGKNIGDEVLKTVRSKLPAEGQAGLDLAVSLVVSTNTGTSPLDVAGELKARAAADLVAKDVRPTSEAAQQGFDVGMAYSRGRVVSAMAVVAQVPQPALQVTTTPIAEAIIKGEPVPVPAPTVAVAPTVTSIVKAKAPASVWTFGAFAAAAATAAAFLL